MRDKQVQVKDNKIDNQNTSIKLEIDEACNGEEAVNQFEQNLLKDCQNPNC